MSLANYFFLLACMRDAEAINWTHSYFSPQFDIEDIVSKQLIIDISSQHRHGGAWPPLCTTNYAHTPCSRRGRAGSVQPHAVIRILLFSSLHVLFHALSTSAVTQNPQSTVSMSPVSRSQSFSIGTLPEALAIGTLGFLCPRRSPA